MMVSTAGNPGNATDATRERIERIRREHFPQVDFSRTPDAIVAASFLRSRLTSVFQPIVEAGSERLVGRQGLLRVFDGAGAAVAPWGLFAQAASDADLVQLDRLARTLHAINYLRTADTGTSLFLHVEPRLLSSVRADHGAWFAEVLEALGLSTRHVTIVLPAAAVEDPVTFVRAAISYRIRGYRVAARIQSPGSAELSHLLLAEPHFVAIDAPAGPEIAPTARLVADLSRQAIRTIARRVESDAHAGAARSAGFHLLQGWHLAPRPAP